MISKIFKFFVENFSPLPAFLAICLIVALSTYWMPIIRLIVSPIGSKAWSVHDVVSAIPKGLSQPAQKSSFKVDSDFIDFVKEILPKSKTNTPRKFSFTFVISILIPFALLGAYLGTLAQFFIILFLNKTRMLQKASGATAAVSLYALLGTYYMGVQAHLAFANTMERVNKSAFGFVTKYFTQQISLCADKGLYVLLMATALAFLSTLFWETSWAHRK